jgi:7-keto-8-aminopelargonate synthetase-like enzyme
MGSFSKTFAANGGFVLCSAAVKQYLSFYSGPTIFSNAISPMQIAAVSRAFDIIFSEEGNLLRRQLLANVNLLRSEMSMRGLAAAGRPSPICPIFVGDEKVARVTSRHVTANGLLANLVEFPAVARGKARFRFQVMANHTSEAIRRAAEILAYSRSEAEKLMATMARE